MLKERNQKRCRDKLKERNQEVGVGVFRMNLVLILLQYYVLCSCIISFVDMLHLYATLGRSYLIPFCNNNIKLANILSSSLSPSS